MRNAHDGVFHQVANGDKGADGTVEGKFALLQVLLFNHAGSGVYLAPGVGCVEHVAIAVARVDGQHKRQYVNLFLGVDDEVALASVVHYRAFQQGIAQHLNGVVLAFVLHFNLGKRTYIGI